MKKLNFLKLLTGYFVPKQSSIFLFFLLTNMFEGNAQVQCSTPDPTVQEYAEMRSKVPALINYLNTRSSSRSNTIREVPLYFTVARNDNGVIPGTYTEISSGQIDDMVSYLNSKVSGGNIHFYRIGDVQYMDYTNFTLNPGNSPYFYDHYNYVSSALNVYIQPYGVGYGPQPDMSLNNAPTQRNRVIGIPEYFADPYVSFNFVHETGHVFTLLHTHGIQNVFNYPEVLTNSSIIDHPYNINGLPRELAIRIDLSSSDPRPYKVINCWDAGDLLCDTEADCNPSQNSFSARCYPAFNPQNISDCLSNLPCDPGCTNTGCIPHNGDYRDYNGDPVTGNSSNIMSYHTFAGSCEGILTTQQKGKMEMGFDTYWNGILTETLFNLKDEVEYKGTSEKVKNVLLKWKHTNTSKFTNSLSDKLGRFQGILYDSNVKTRAKKLGSDREILFFNNDMGILQPYSTDKYNYLDWLDRVSTWDAYRIANHVSGPSYPQITSGYDKIAADVNNSGTITLADAVTIRRLIMGIIENFKPNFEEPWLFVPEFIPQDYPTGFDSNPYNMNINGQTVTNLDYTKDTWEYPITNGTGGKTGYDAIKIGDVAAAGQFQTPSCIDQLPNLQYPLALLSPNNIYEITFKPSGFDNIAAFQFGFSLNTEKLEILEVLNGSFSDFSETENFANPHGEKEKLSFAWFKTNGVSTTLLASESLFKLKVKVLQPISDLNQVLSFGHSDIENAFFNTNGCKTGVTLNATIHQISNLGDNSSDRSSNDLTSKPENKKLFCYPNPSTNSLNIYFESTQNNSGTMIFSNIQGQSLKSISVDIKEGINQFNFDNSDFENLPSGILTITLRDSNGLSTVKLVRL